MSKDLTTIFKAMYKTNPKLLDLCDKLNLEALDKETGEYLSTKDIHTLLTKTKIKTNGKTK